MAIGKKFLGDAVENFIAMCMFILAQHGIIMPFIAKAFSESFSEIILFVTLSNMFVYVTAGALGNTLLMRNVSYRDKGVHGDFGVIVLVFSVVLIIIVGVLYFIFSVLDFTEAVLIMGTVFLFLVRSYFNATVIFRRRYIIIAWQNTLYLLGAVLTCHYLQITTPVTVFFSAELVASVITVKFFDFLEFSLSITSEMVVTLKKYVNFAVVTFIDNMVTYADRLLIYPMLGGDALTILFAITVASKGMLLLVSPIKNVLLGLLSGTGVNERKSAAIYLRKTLFRCFLPVYTISVVTSWAGLFVLYPQFLSVGVNYIFITSLGITMTVMNSLCNVFCMKFISSRILSLFSVVRLIVFVCITLSFTKWWSMDGFIYSCLLTECIVLCFNAYCVWRLIYRDNDKIFAME